MLIYQWIKICTNKYRDVSSYINICQLLRPEGSPIFHPPPYSGGSPRIVCEIHSGKTPVGPATKFVESKWKMAKNTPFSTAAPPKINISYR